MENDTLHTVQLSRVRTGPGKPGKSWNFILAFSRTGKDLVLESSVNLLNSAKNIKYMEGSKAQRFIATCTVYRAEN